MATGSSDDLYGAAPDKCPTALLLIDVINDMEFPEGDQLLEHALPMARRLAALKKRAMAAGIPIVYVNDNFGRWRSDFSHLVDHCLEDGVRGEPVARLLVPEKSDYFVLKPKHSAFYSTSLGVLLDCFGARRLILTGVAANICVLFTANDAHMRDFDLCIPADCVASNTAEETRFALALMERTLGADVRPSDQLELEAWSREPARRGKSAASHAAQ